MARGRGSLGLFLEQCRRNFATTGALVPSSKSLARAMTAHVEPRSGPQRILEVGPGTGVFTLEIARRMGPADRLDIYEINAAFADHLEERLARDPAFEAVRGRTSLHRRDVLEVPREAVYDVIVSSLPLNNLEPQPVRALLEVLMARLAPGGVLSYFEYVLIRTLKGWVSSAAERERLRLVGEVTGEFVRRYQARCDPVLLNLPPALARHLVKPVPYAERPAARSRALRPAAAVQ